MKTNIFGKLAFVVCSALVISACNDNERIVEYNKLTLDKNEAVFDLDKSDNLTAEFNITEGNGNYKVNVEDAEVAEVTIDGTKVTVTALHVGETTAKVYDWVKHSAEIRIKVIDKFELSDSELEMLYGEIRSIEIYSGNGDYQVTSSNEDVATVAVEGGFINITAVGAGEADVTVKDAEGKNTTLKVTVSYKEFTLGNYENPIALNIDETKEIEIVSANGVCIAESSDSEKVEAVVSEDGKKITLKALKFGEATVTVTDRSIESKIINVKVSPAELTLSTESVEVYPEENSLIDIQSGNGGYELSSDNEEIATAGLTEEDRIQINALSVGTANITVTDAAGKEKVISVKVKARLTVGSTVIDEIISSNQTGVTIPITSGNGKYKITASLPLVASISEDQQSVILRPENVGSLGYNMKATLTDAAGESVEITVNIMHKNYLETQEVRYFVNGIFKGKDKSSIDFNEKDGVRREFVFVYNEKWWQTDEGHKMYFICEGQNGIVVGPAEFSEMQDFKTSHRPISDVRVDKYDGTWVWVSFQEEGLNARSYIVAKR